MPDTATTTAPKAEDKKIIALPDNMKKELVINRGKDETIAKAGLDWKFELFPLRKGKNKTGPQKFAYKPVQPTETDPVYNWDNWLAWLDKKQAVNSSYQRVAGMSALWHDNAMDDKTGVFDEPEFIKNVTTFSSRGETFAALEEEQEELRVNLNVNISELRAGKIDATEFAKRASEIGDRLNEIADSIKAKEEKAAAKGSTPEAMEAAA